MIYAGKQFHAVLLPEITMRLHTIRDCSIRHCSLLLYEGYAPQSEGKKQKKPKVTPLFKFCDDDRHLHSFRHLQAGYICSLMCLIYNIYPSSLPVSILRGHQYIKLRLTGNQGEGICRTCFCLPENEWSEQSCFLFISIILLKTYEQQWRKYTLRIRCIVLQPILRQMLQTPGA